MNRLVLIGNGFDLAHELKTSYKDFIYWYWCKCGERLLHEFYDVVSDELCSFKLNKAIVSSWYSVWTGHYYKRKDPTIPWDVNDVVNLAKENRELCDFSYNSVFFSNIQHSIDTKGWVDIENEYYKLLEEYTLLRNEPENVITLNKQLKYLQKLLTEYLSTINKQDNQLNEKIEREIYEPIRSSDISIEATTKLNEYIGWCKKQEAKVWKFKLSKYGIKDDLHDVDDFLRSFAGSQMYPRAYMLPDNIMLLDFNYTKTGREYLRKNVNIFSHIYIHGQLEAPDGMIFGYGDEFDDKYKKLQALNNNECLANIKTIKYQESDNYRKVLHFIDSAPFQVCIMGHSCGNSDRTLLNTIFEHKNCISIKPYFYKKDDGTDSYIETIQNISRNFKDMKLMRDRVVNKLYCEPLAQD